MKAHDSTGGCSLARLVRRCVVCGARVKNLNPKTKTCDPTCTAARKAGRTREEQQRHEAEEVWRADAVTYCPTCGMLNSQCDCWDAVNHV
jgi:hypothetical protein